MKLSIEKDLHHARTHPRGSVRFQPGVLITGCIGIALIFFTGAWSTKGFPPFEQVHQLAIQNVLSNKFSPDVISLLQDMQKVVDEDQQATNSFEHSMTGLTNKNDTTNIETPIYLAKSEAFIHNALSNAIIARHTTNLLLAYTNLGKAIHPLEDATSPAHQPFQPWKYNESWGEVFHHIFQEYSYPDNTNKLDQVNQRAQLEGAVRYAYDIFMESNTMPSNFYNHTTFELALPTNYFNPRTK